MSEHKLRISVKGIFKNSDNKVLLVKLGRNGQDFWSAPGGGVEEDEAMGDTLSRELREETGYSVEIGDIIFVQDIKFASGARQLELFFNGKVLEKISEAEEEFGFFSEEEFKKIKFMPKGFDPFAKHQTLPFVSEV
ncbi:MAG: NUDIX hydrolase [Patescibacteria group bacterium]|jgi:ADP-ribose pyrophosphatase YjhB (NUDIX family)